MTNYVAAYLSSVHFFPCGWHQKTQNNLELRGLSKGEIEPERSAKKTWTEEGNTRDEGKTKDKQLS